MADTPEDELHETDFNEVLQHMQAEDDAGRESTLASEESFRDWISNHPALRQMIPVDSYSEIVPTILRALRALFGLDSRDAEPDEPATVETSAAPDR